MEKNNINDVLKNLNILFVDDEDLIIDVMKDILEFFFRNVYYANNGVDGIQICRDNDIDVIMSDITMPKMNGIEMVNEIRSFNNSIKVIFLSAHNEIDYLNSIKELKASSIIKPINSIEMIKAFSKIIN
jgi:YesN/AraC family two-component response regulator